MSNQREPCHHAYVRNGRIEILIDFDVLPIFVWGACATFGSPLHSHCLRVTDAEVFARELARALSHESETGSTRISDMLDEAVLAAMDNGAEGIEEISEEAFEADCKRIEELYKNGLPAVQAPDWPGLSAAARDVLAERQRQIEVEGWSFYRDDRFFDGQLAKAAAAYAWASALPDSQRGNARDGGLMKQFSAIWALLWPFSINWWRLTTRRRDLVKAGALILAEIERLDRAAGAKGEDPPGLVAGTACPRAGGEPADAPEDK